MWVAGSLLFLVAAVWLVMEALNGPGGDGRMLAGARIRAPHATVPMVEKAERGGGP
jgi:hypothetical protein